MAGLVPLPVIAGLVLPPVMAGLVPSPVMARLVPPPVMAGLVPAIHAFLRFHGTGVDGRDKPGHDTDDSL